MPCPAREEFQIGWICALPIEAAAAKEMLDEDFGILEEQDAVDTNSYRLGRIGKHYVAIACLPGGQYGACAATTVANNMVRTFCKSLRIGLMVGVGEGIPSTDNDIRLGDIVISCPAGSCGGVVQYDMGKVAADGVFCRTGSLNSPPRSLLTAVNNMRAAELTDDPRYPEYLQRAIRRTQRTQVNFGRPSPQSDRLFKTKHEHPATEKTCDMCPREWEETRSERSGQDPRPHYGIIASGNSVIKHGCTREQLQLETGALCFEMEAAGLMLDFPCIVIRGICDYSDSHKNKQWQGYAALAAAAYAKELLEYVPRGQVLQENLAVDVCSSIENLTQEVKGTNQRLDIAYDQQERHYREQTARADVNAQGGDDSNALQAASYRGHDKIVQMLLQHKADANAQGGGDQIQVTEDVIKTAVGNQRDGEEVMALLLDRRGDQIQITEDVVKAAVGNPTKGKEVMALLLDRRGDQIQITKDVVKAAAGNQRTGKEVMSLLLRYLERQIQFDHHDLQTSSWNGNIEKVEQLLADRANATSANPWGWTPLHAASWNGHIQVVKLLLAKGAQPTAKSNTGWTPLDAAFTNGHVDTVRLLLLHDPDAVADFTPTSFSDIKKSAVLELDGDKLGVRYVGTPNKTRAAVGSVHANKPISPLDDVFYFEIEVISSGHNGVIGLGICREGFSVERMPGWEHTSWGYHGDDGKKFHSAAQGQPYAEKFGDGDIIGCRLEVSSGNLEFVKNGRSLGVAFTNVHGFIYPVVGIGSYGAYIRVNFAPLRYPCRGDQIQITGKGADVNAQGGEYGNALQAASSQGQEKIVQLLLQKQVDVNAQDGGYGNALLAPSSRGRGDEVKITEAAVKAAAGNEENRRGAMPLLLEKIENDVKFKASDEYIWVRELQTIGYSLQEIADLLLEKAHDSPWIYFEPTNFSHCEIQLDRHIPRCAHHFRSPCRLGPTHDSEIVLMSKHESSTGDHGDAVEMVEELCGLAGISPTTRTMADWTGSAEFGEQNKVVAVSYRLPTDESHMVTVESLRSRISRALEGFCSAAGLIQANDLCCDSFTVLKFGSYNREASAIVPGEVITVNFQLVINLAEALKSAQEPMSKESTSGEVLAASKAILELVSPEITEAQGGSDIQWCLQLCALAVQFICLGFLSYTQAHIGPIQPFFLDTPLRRVTLLGLKSERKFPHLVAELVDLTCLGNMTRSPVLMFHGSQDLAQGQTSEGPQNLQMIQKYDILGHVEDILDTWGPGSLVYPKNATGPPVAIKIGDGFIFAGEGGKYHWAQEMEDVTGLSAIDLEGPLLIGAVVTANNTCSLVKAECRSISANALEYLGTSPSSWRRSQRQLGFQGGQYMVGQFTETWNKQSGIPVKDVALANPNEELIQYMDEYWGVQVSYCTGVARRVLLRTLVADLVPPFSKGSDLQTNCVVSKLRDESLKLAELQDWLRKLEEDSREQILKMIRRILDTLRPTGLDPTEKYFCVAWPFEGDTTRCFKIPLEDQSSWAKILADSHDCATFAYITMECLETDDIKCSGTPEAWNNNIYLLETAVTHTAREEPRHPWTLMHEKVYFFSKLDSMFWVKVQREHPARPANLVALMAVQSIPRDIRQRLYLSEKRKQRDRLRECSTVWVQGEIVSVFSVRRNQQQIPAQSPQ